MGPEEELKQHDQNDAWALVFHKLRAEASLKHDYNLKDAKSPDFRGRNRYRDVSPYDHSRIHLKQDGLDYINASLVKAPKADRNYILTQGPLPNTAGHFWLMVWEQNSRAVLMLNRLVERGQVKCFQYYPLGSDNGGQDVLDFEDVGLTVTFLYQQEEQDYVIRTLRLTNMDGEEKDVLQFHYTTWPDMDVPQCPTAFLDFLFTVRRSGALDRSVGPPVIHCSAGIGRSGTFCLVDTCLVLIERNRSANTINVYEILMDMRQYRMGLIQTPSQLRFSYLAIVEGSRRVLAASPDSGFSDQDSTQNGMTDDVDDIPNMPPPIPPRRQIGRIDPGPTADSPTALNGAGEYSPLIEEDVYTPTQDLNEDDLGQEFDREQMRKKGFAIRRRKREERLKNTADQIAQMRERQMANHINPNQSFISRYFVGLSVALLFGSFLMYQYYSSKS